MDGAGQMIATETSQGQWKEVEGIIFESDITSYNEGGSNYYDPSRDEAVKDRVKNGYVFAGWYIDDQCKTIATFDFMTEGITVYAKWQKIQYRVFLHPNVDPTDSSLSWGSDTQQMNFRVSYGDKVSSPTGTRDDYELMAWYMDEDMNELFDDDVFILSEETVFAPYDKDADMTDPMDKYGVLGTDPYNSDARQGRFWITKKLDLYARWREKLIGARGINIVYDPDIGTDEPHDNTLYLDQVGAIAQGAATPPENMQFLYWTVMKWDGSTSEYIETDVNVYPGDTFTVRKADAREEDITDGTETEEVNKKYTIRLKAIYDLKEAPKDTHINWYMNDKDPSEILQENKNLQINQAVEICTAPTRPGYKFLGWARENEYELDEDGNPTGDVITYYGNVTENDLFLKWDAENNRYLAKNDDGEWVEVTQAAADERMPYHGLYAVWEASYYYVYYSGSGKLYAYDLDEKVNLQAHITADCLYGGYSTAYGGYTVTEDDMKAAAKDGYVQIDTTANPKAIYAPDSLYVKGLTKWWKTMATTAYISLTPSTGDVYYVKEVPVKYLTTRIQYIYDWSQDNKINQIYLMTIVDDKLYNKVGFELTISETATKDAKELVGSFTFEQRNTTVKVTTKPTDFNGVVRGWIGYVDGRFTTGEDGFIAANTVFTIKPFWITKDGVTVKGTARTFTTGADGTKSTIAEVTE